MTEQELQRLRDYLARNEGRDPQIVVADMIFNLGEQGFLGFSDLVGALKSGEWAAAADAMRDSKWFGQVGDRAVRDADGMQAGNLPPKVSKESKDAKEGKETK